MAGESINMTNVRLDMPIGEDGSNTLGDLLLKTDFVDPFETDESAQSLAKLMAKLKDSDRQIVELFYGLVGDGLSTKEIAEVVGKSAVEVNRALKVARFQMRREAGLC